jgi:hypothetical protein
MRLLRARCGRGGVASWGAQTRPDTTKRPICRHSNLRLVSWTAGARTWIDALPSARLFAQFGMLPSVVYPVATLARTRRSAAGAHALLRAFDGRWVMIEAAPLEGAGDEQIAVTMRSATTTESFDIVCRAYALSPRQHRRVPHLPRVAEDVAGDLHSYLVARWGVTSRSCSSASAQNWRADENAPRPTRATTR